MSSRNIQQGEIIRDSRTTHPHEVVGKTLAGIMVIDLTENINPAPIKIILPRDMDYWVKDTDIDKLDQWEEDRTGLYPIQNGN